MATIQFVEGVNLFCGDHDPTDSKHLTIETLKLPVLEEKTTTYLPGGGSMAVEMSMGVVDALTATFKLNGFDPQVLSLFGLGTKRRNTYTAYGALFDKRLGTAVQVKAILEARLTSIQMDEFKRGDVHGHDYSLKEITRYELWFDGAEKVAFDFWTNLWRIDGVDQNADLNRILGVQ